MKINNKKAFTIIEVIIGIFIFSLGLVSVFMLFSQSTKMNVKSRNIIIASNLAREGVEFIKNIRDSNYKTYHKFNWIPNDLNKYESENYFQTGMIYKIENNFDDSDSSFPIKIKKFTGNFSDIGNFQLCLTNEKKYIYNSNCSDENKTDFYRYLKIEDAKYEDSGKKTIPETYKITSVVEWKKTGGGKIEIPFILTDWKKL